MRFFLAAVAIALGLLSVGMTELRKPKPMEQAPSCMTPAFFLFCHEVIRKYNI